MAPVGDAMEIQHIRPHAHGHQTVTPFDPLKHLPLYAPAICISRHYPFLGLQITMKMAIIHIERSQNRLEDASHKGPVGNHLNGAEKADSECAICLTLISGGTGAVIRDPMMGHINHPPLESPYPGYASAFGSVH